MNTPSVAIVVLGRSPVRSRVKQRLAAEVGDDTALAVYRWLLARTLAVSADTGLPRFLFATDVDNDEMRELAQCHGFQLQGQCQGDLGERMAAAFRQVHRQFRQVLLVGTDCPVLSAADFWRLAGATGAGGCALVAAEDGGYVALASGSAAVWQRGNPLDDVAWGTGRARSDTHACLRRYDEKVTICGNKWDLDTMRDWHRAREECRCPV